ncbi:hypothetical protein B0T24DRAFT_636571 [Lasiosphaeria ovina]|uniref:Uncharacterized protein n=1 Tax=Lasiosphaeria ovina TaxID=92902 RepID=A0AAE0JWP2_9PEZI|nr:hypothetical protein B0T24DRAFT_636571 [Lasiosphaeria ovina]
MPQLYLPLRRFTTVVIARATIIATAGQVASVVPAERAIIIASAGQVASVVPAERAIIIASAGQVPLFGKEETCRKDQEKELYRECLLVAGREFSGLSNRDWRRSCLSLRCSVLSAIVFVLSRRPLAALAVRIFKMCPESAICDDQMETCPDGVSKHIVLFVTPISWGFVRSACRCSCFRGTFQNGPHSHF